MSNPTPKPNPTQADRPLAAIILAAGQGKRMNSDLPKVALSVAGKPIVWWVVKAVREAGAVRVVLVVGHGAEEVQGIFAGDDADLDFVTQYEQLGTGHATACAETVLRDFEGDIVVLAGDGPLIRVETIQRMHRGHVEAGAAATLATSVIADPTGYGRIVRDDEGRFLSIVEHKNATEAQREIHEIYPSYACFDAKTLFEALGRLAPDEVSGEYYVTEIPCMLRAQGERVELVDAVPPEDVLSINTPQQLAEVEAILNRRISALEVKAGS